MSCERTTVDRERSWLYGRACQRKRRAWLGSGIEPPLHEALADPIVRAVMQSDGVSSADLGSAITRVQRRLRQIPSPGLPIRDPGKEKGT